MDETPTVKEIRLSKNKRVLTVTFKSGESYEIPAELLRVESPSAEVQGHNAGQKKIVPDKENVKIVKIEAVGNYAVTLYFDDDHDTGIYSWSTLQDMGQNQDAMMAAYRKATSTMH